MSRGLTLGALIAAATLASVHCANLVAAAYAVVAQRQLDKPSAVSTQSAARISASLTPWAAPRAATWGWLLGANGDAAAMEKAYRRALHWSPADALLWTEYAQAVARAGRFDTVLDHAVARAATLAPTSPAVRSSLAAMGLSYWHHGSADVREYWLESMRFELKRAPATFLNRVVTRGHARRFCDDFKELLGQEQWCESAVEPARGCFDVTPKGPVPCSHP